MDYQFEYKVFGNALGINEEYKTLQKDNIRTVKLVTGIDILGRITSPYIVDINRGFIPARLAISSVEEANIFCRSHKPLYIMIRDISAIVKATVKIDVNTGMILVDKSTISLLVPNGHYDNKIVCSRLSDTTGLGAEAYPLEQLKRLETCFYNQLTVANTEDRLRFLCARILKDGVS